VDVLLSWLAQRIGGRKLLIVWAVLGTLGLAATTAVITGAMFLPMSKMVERISAATPPQEQATAATFGPVIERTLLAVEEGEESKGLNLDRDRLVDFPANFSQMETQARETWLRGSKVNLFFKFPKELQSWEMVGNHLNWSIVQPKYLDPVVEGDLWTQLSAKDLMHNFCQPREVIMAQADKLMSALALNWLNPPITIAFNTKDNAGLMQITGFTEHPRGVKLRYKLVQGGATNAAAIAKPAPDDFKRTFGPVIEREVVEAIDFDSGKVANSLPESVTKSPDIAMNVLNAVSWMEREGMDAISEPSGDLKGVGMKARAVDKVAWDHLSPAEIVATLAIITRETWQDLDPRDKTDAERKTPATWVFETREGGKGILQVLEQTKAGVKLRYKLVQGGATNAAAGDKPAPVFHGASFVLPLRQTPAPAEAAPVPVPVVVRSIPALVPVGGILLLLIGGIAVIVLAVRKSKLGAGRTLAVGCGVIMLGFVLVLLLFAVISMGRTIQAAATRWSVQHARLQSARSTPPVAPGLAFGPVMERVVPNGDKCLNLLTGQLLPLPGLMTLAPDVRRAQADVYWPSGENDTRVLWILDCRVLDLDPAAWSNLSAAALEEKFHQLADSRRSSPGQNETRLPPGLYGFSGYRKTGLIQVIDDTNNYGGVKLRYKLVQGGATSTAVAGKINEN